MSGLVFTSTNQWERDGSHHISLASEIDTLAVLMVIPGYES